MSDSEGTPTLVGQYSAPAPSFDPSSYSTFETLDAVVSDLVYNSDGSKATLSKDTTAEAWYRLETDLKAAETALAGVNDKFAKEIKAVKDALEGDAGDAFSKYATAILNISEEVYSTLMKKQFGTNSGNIGHSEQAFADSWWQIHQTADDALANMVSALEDSANSQIQAATDVNQLIQISTQLSTEISNARTGVNNALLKDLQNALSKLGQNYYDRGADFVPLYISDGNTATGAPAGSFQQQVNQPKQIHAADPAPTGIQNAELNTNKPQQNTLASAQPLAPGETTPGQPTELPAAQTAMPKPALTGAPAEGTPASQGGVNPAEQQALNDAKNAAGEAIDGLTAQTNDPKRKQALEAAKQAAQGAIDGLTNPAAQGLAGGPGSPGDVQQPVTGGGADPAAQQALANAKNAAGQAIDGLIGQSKDPKRKQALEDAKQAAEDAIDGLTNPAGLAGHQLAGGPAEGNLEAAKNAAGKAIDDLAKPGDSEARQQALDDAKQAAMKAVGDLGDQPGGADDNAPAGQQDRGPLMDAKHAAEKAIDDLIGKTDDPDRKHALEDAKHAMSDAIDKTAAPEHFKQVEDAKHAADKAIDGLGEPGDDPQRQHALDAAKAAAEKAIGRINDAPELSGPGHEQALEHAKEEADKAIDALCKPDDTPAERQALADAKEAVNKAIDGIGEEKGNAMHQFLTSSGPKEFVPPRGGLDGVGGHGPVAHEAAGGPVGGGPGPGGNPATAGGPPAGKFDTQPYQGGQPANAQGAPVAAAPGQSGAASAGAPMGPMGGGMGGGAGNQGEKEREPQIWMQAEHGAWGNEEDCDEPRSHVLGRG
ncbi:large repetitive protein [Amycolatopsis mongoliensis]|uniref:Large repetitive protein n=1 Tax=Amycolatopsis mongoliensis TaxID=715475 RepID=A0A9Y2JIX5_9PSEU|nr:large repetitive protein [Amycolatopsis sp. 4-36]WIX98221.1 large repetitive protein [Amycolatopsis sp. 4-36]